LALAMALLCLTLPEGAVFVAGLLGLRLAARFGRSGGARLPLWPFLAPAAVLAGGVWVRWRTSGLWLPPAGFALLHPRPGQAAEGLFWLRDAALSCVSLLLLAYPVAYLLRGRLSGTGARALLLALIWAALTVLQGRAPLPFAEALVPALPLAFVAVQEGMIEALDGPSRAVRRLALAALCAGIVGSALASKEPGDLGPLPIARWHERWMSASGSAQYGCEQPLGRRGLEEEVARTVRLRALGIFLRDALDPSFSVLTP